MPKKKDALNLLPRGEFEKTTTGRVIAWMLTTFRFIVILVEFVVITGFLLRFWLDVQISNLNDEISQKSALVSSKASFEKEFRHTQNQLALFRQLTVEGTTSQGIFADIVSRLPADTRLTSVTREESLLRISGESKDETSIKKLVANLEANPVFVSVNLNRLAAEDADSLIEFDIEAMLSFDNTNGT